jgi:hypothetical protein
MPKGAAQSKMTKTPEDSDPSNPILEYPGYYLPPFFATMLGELPNFALPDWGALPPLLQGQSPTPSPSPNPSLPPPIDVDPPARPPEWLFGPPRIVRSLASGPRPAGLPGMITAYLRSRGGETTTGSPALAPVAYTAMRSGGLPGMIADLLRLGQQGSQTPMIDSRARTPLPALSDTLQDDRVSFDRSIDPAFIRSSRGSRRGALESLQGVL